MLNLSLSYEQRLKVAEMAKEITISFGGRLQITNTATKQDMNDSVSEAVNKMYSESFSQILKLVEGK